MPENSERRRIVVNLDQPQVQAPAHAPRTVNPPTFGQPNADADAPPRKRGLFGGIAKILALLLLVAILASTFGGYFWWSSYQKSPAYSLALLVDAARRDDKPEVEKFLDTDAVVDSVVPQVVDSAKERYGRGLPPAVVDRATGMLAPVLPAVKERARVEIPRLIRDKMNQLPKVSPWLLGVGINRAATIEQTGDNATLRTKVQDREVELSMQRAGDKWKVTGLKDAVLADKIADAVGQRVMQLASQQRPNAAQQNKAAADLAEQIKRQIQQLAP